MTFFTDRSILWWLIIGWFLIFMYATWLVVKFSLIVCMWIIAFPIMLAARF